MAIELRSVTTKPDVSRKSKTGGVSTVGAINRSRQPVNQEADSIKLTASVFSLQQAEMALASVPLVNAAHVTQVTDVLNRGDYQINAERVAEKIIDLEQRLPG